MKAAGLTAAVFLAAANHAGAEEERGVASIYRDVEVSCPGRKYDASAMIAAHKTLPCGSVVEVTNVKNGRTASVTIVDQGPHKEGRIIDLSPAAAIKAGFSEIDGLADVSLRVVMGFNERWRVAVGHVSGVAPYRHSRRVKIKRVRKR